MSNFHGPQLPPNLRETSDDEQCSSEESDSTPDEPGLFFGPALPPQFKKHDDGGNLGNSVKASQETASRDKMIGPALPPRLLKTDVPDKSEGNDTEEICGPLLPGSEEEKRSYTHGLLEMQAEVMKRKLADKETDSDTSEVASRETWMLELPDKKSSFLGLGSRTFRKKEGPDMSDRSSWTDTPESRKQKKEPKMDLKEESRRRAIEAKDACNEEALKKSKHKQHKKSLLEQHEKKLRKERKKKRKKEKDKPEERRCFSREIDLQVNRFDEAKRKAVIKKAGLLDDRFSSGESKFL